MAKNFDRLSESKVVGTSLLVSLSDVILNYLVALFTGSVAVLAQSLQGLSDLTTTAVLYLGVRRSKRGPDAAHPLGYGREVFFWTLIAAVIMFVGTGVLSVVIGYRQFTNPTSLDSIWLALGMLSFGLISNLYAWTKSVRRLSQIDSREPWWRRIIGSSMVESKVTFSVDLMGSAAALLGLIAVGLYTITGNVRFDGLGAMLVGLITMLAASLIMVDVHNLIVGKSIPKQMMGQIKGFVEAHPHVNSVVDLYATYIGSNKLLVVIEVHLKDELTTDQIEKLLDKIKHDLSRKMPFIDRIQIEVETPDSELNGA